MLFLLLRVHFWAINHVQQPTSSNYKNSHKDASDVTKFTKFPSVWQIFLYVLWALTFETLGGDWICRWRTQQCNGEIPMSPQRKIFKLDSVGIQLTVHEQKQLVPAFFLVFPFKVWNLLCMFLFSSTFSVSFGWLSL